MDLINNLKIIRRSLMKVIIIIILFGILSYIFSNKILYILYRPLNSSLFFYSIQEPFFARITVSIFCGLFLLTPFIFYEISSFVIPLFSEKIRIFSLIITISATILFLTGSILAYFVIIPSGLNFLLSYESEHMKAMLSLRKYLSFSLWMIYSFGVIFELPLIMLILNKIGIVNVRMLVNNRKYAILLIAIASAVITPTPDAYNMLLMMGPLIILYEISIITLRLSNSIRS
jgi:sec-independent protein translocase protein TatC